MVMMMVVLIRWFVSAKIITKRSDTIMAVLVMVLLLLLGLAVLILHRVLGRKKSGVGFEMATSSVAKAIIQKRPLTILFNQLAAGSRRLSVMINNIMIIDQS